MLWALFENSSLLLERYHCQRTFLDYGLCLVHSVFDFYIELAYCLGLYLLLTELTIKPADNRQEIV